jgi:deazaflavin-dependent oxidoreductase (nitroreductase family)
MMFHRDGDQVLVIASNAGAPEHPDWYTDPRVTVEIGDESYEARAVTAAREERERLWRTITDTYPSWWTKP